MSTISSEDSGPISEAPELGWQVRGGLTLIQAEELLDHLEASGIKQREVKIEPAGVTVRWRAE
jgi:hypothetical protein